MDLVQHIVGEIMWIDDERLWYRVRRQKDCHQFIICQPNTGKQKQMLMDHEALAAALRHATGSDTQLRLANLKVTVAEGEVQLAFASFGKHFTYSDRVGLCVEEGEVGGLQHGKNQHRATLTNGLPCEVTFVNHSTHRMHLFWLDGDGVRHSYGSVEAGASKAQGELSAVDSLLVGLTVWSCVQGTFAGHVWLFRGKGWRATVETPEGGGDIVLDDDFVKEASSSFSSSSSVSLCESEDDADDETTEGALKIPASTTGLHEVVSPDGQWTSYIRHNNVWLKRADSPGEGEALTRDGKPGYAYIAQASQVGPQL